MAQLTVTNYFQHLYNVSPVWLTPELLKILSDGIVPLLFYNGLCGADLCRVTAGGEMVLNYNLPGSFM